MHKLFRDRFLGTASFLLGPNDKPGGEGGTGNDTNDDNVGGASNDTNDDDNGAGGEAGEAGDGETGEADGDGQEGGGDGEGAADEGEEDELAGLTPEQRAKVEARLAREVGWRDRQIDKLYAKRRSAEEDVRAAGTIVERQPGAENLTAEQIETRARELAKTMTAQETYDNACNSAFSEGKKQFEGKWDGALAKLPKLGGVDVSDMQNIMATDQPHVVLYQLSNPETYERVMGLPPAKRFAEFVKLALKQFPKPSKGESKRPGDAPPPPRAINGSGRRVAAQTVDLHDDTVSDEQWYKARNEARRKKFTSVE